MGELVIEPDYINPDKITFHINEHGLEILKEIKHKTKYTYAQPLVVEKIFYPTSVFKSGKTISVSHKEEPVSTYTLGTKHSINYNMRFDDFIARAKDHGYNLITREGDIHANKFYRYVSTVNLYGLGGLTEIGKFTLEKANKIYDFLKPAIEGLLNRKNTQMDHLLHTLEWGPRALELGTAHPNLKAAQARVNGASTGGSKTRRRRHRKRKTIP
jgi:hypothetical protein